MLKPKFIQFDQPETKKVHFWQANAVLKYKPDVIFLEYPINFLGYPNNKETPDTIFNRYAPKNKPIKYVTQMQNSFRRLEESPWLLGDIKMWDNIVKLWNKNHQIFIYNLDAPSELTSQFFITWKNMYPCAQKNWLWWVHVYLREIIMTKNVKWALKYYKLKQAPIILVFLQKFHWKHVKFLLKKPTHKQIWNYYFGNFPEINPTNIVPKIKKENKVFYKYWKNFHLFRSKNRRNTFSAVAENVLRL